MERGHRIVDKNVTSFTLDQKTKTQLIDLGFGNLTFASGRATARGLARRGSGQAVEEAEREREREKKKREREKENTTREIEREREKGDRGAT